ncbi:MAG: hypothetical protein GY854_05495 [Deltaproteobacteria bacterium]|nr:hypothetical protein [Deltaproteobacteria bacterium]
MKPRRYHRAFWIAFAAIFLVHPERTIAEEKPDDILVVANRNVPVDKVNVDDLRDIFLGIRTYWKSGVRAVAINAPAGTPLRKDFRRRLVNFSEYEEERYWQEQKIKAGKKPPIHFAEKSILKAVFKIKGSVSYIYRSQYIKGVSKVILVIPSK